MEPAGVTDHGRYVLHGFVLRLVKGHGSAFVGSMWFTNALLACVEPPGGYSVGAPARSRGGLAGAPDEQPPGGPTRAGHAFVNHMDPKNEDPWPLTGLNTKPCSTHRPWSVTPADSILQHR